VYVTCSVVGLTGNVLVSQMKFLIRFFRELQRDHFAKRGISWHGVAVLVNRAAGRAGFNFPEVAPGELERAFEFQILYFHDILDGVDEQSTATLIAIIDVLLARLRAMFPATESVSFQAVRAVH
jgi:hypothetical protein